MRIVINQTCVGIERRNEWNGGNGITNPMRVEGVEWCDLRFDTIQYIIFLLSVFFACFCFYFECWFVGFV